MGAAFVQVRKIMVLREGTRTVCRWPFVFWG